jgi:hypothetical protein
MLGSTVLTAVGQSQARADAWDVAEGDESQGLITYAGSTSILGSVIESNVGSLVDGDCVLEVSGYKSADSDTVEVMQEIAFDPTSCTQTIAIARYARAEIPDSVKSLLSEDDETLMTVEETGLTERLPTVGLAPMATPKSYKGGLKAMIKDPIHLVTTSTKTTLSWEVSNSKIDSYSGGHTYSWLAASGWTRTANHGWQDKISSTAAYADTTADYKNSIFCWLISPGNPCTTTYAKHLKTRVEGRANGAYVWSYSMTKSGGCRDLLGYYFVVGW